LEKTTVGELVENKSEDIKMVTCNNTITDILKIMRDNNIHCVPLWEERFNQDRGLIDVGDIVAFFASFQKKEGFNFEEVKEAFLHSPVTAKLADFSHLNFCQSVKSSDNLLRLVRCMSGEDRLQRVILRDEKDNISNIIGQTLVLQFLYENSDTIKSSPFQNISNFASQSLNLRTSLKVKKPIYASDLQSQKTVLSISDTTTALDAFYYLNSNKLRAVPILTDSGKVVGVISTADIMGLSEETWHLLEKPALEYLNGINKYKEPIIIKPTLKFKKVLRALYNNEVHHIYIVDEDKLKSVVSVSDVLHYFKNFART